MMTIKFLTKLSDILLCPPAESQQNQLIKATHDTCLDASTPGGETGFSLGSLDCVPGVFVFLPVCEVGPPGQRFSVGGGAGAGPGRQQDGLLGSKANSSFLKPIK